MKRNWEVIRKTLVAIEDLTEANSAITNYEIAEKTAYDPTTVSYHLKLLIDAKLIEGSCSDTLGNNAPTTCVIKRLTWDGHEFLDNIKSDTVWATIKRTAAEKGIELSLNTVTTLATNIIGKLIS